MNELLKNIIELAKAAGQAIVEVANSADLGIQKKADKSPVTLADFRANDLIVAGLKQFTPDIPVISEEGEVIANEERLSWPKCWLVDPLDGTRGFIDGSGEYTVNIALIEDHLPVMSVIYSPHLDKLYYAVKGEGAFIETPTGPQQIQAKNWDGERPLDIAVSQYHSAKWLERLLGAVPKYELVKMNSSIKICFCADGTADIYPRLGPTSEWDTAAGHCIVEEAGGLVVDLTGQTLHYNARETLENPSFIVLADPSQLQNYLSIIDNVRRST